VRPEYFPVAGEPLVHALKEHLGPEFIPEVEAAWTDVFAVIQEEMLIGLEAAVNSKSPIQALSLAVQKFDCLNKRRSPSFGVLGIHLNGEGAHRRGFRFVEKALE
jgi:hypothetical protein